MELPEKNGEDEFLTVTIKGRLITEDDPNFDGMFASSAGNSEIDKSEIVLPVFDVLFRDFDEQPEHRVKDMIQRELNSSVADNTDLVRILRSADPEEVSSMPPLGEPKTRTVSVGEVAVAPDQSGIITQFHFDNLVDMFKSDMP